MIHRHPYDIYRSTLHTMIRVLPVCALQPFTRAELVEWSLVQYQTLLDAYLDQRQRIPGGRLVEISFADLDRSPVDTLRRVYSALGLPDFYEAEADVVEYLGTLKGYQKNTHDELAAGEKQIIADRWRRSFDEWRYEA